MTTHDPPHYVAADIKSRLAEDPRTLELGIQVDVRGDVVFLRGNVASPQRRELIEAVAREAAGGRRIANDVTVVEMHPAKTEDTAT